MVWAYSLDLRKKVLAFIKKGNKRQEASQLFEISQRTIERWIKQEKETGNLEPIKRDFAYKKIDYEQLREHIKKHPDQFLYEIAEEFSVTLQAIFYALKKLKITRKKKLLYTKKETKKKEKIF